MPARYCCCCCCACSFSACWSFSRKRDHSSSAANSLSGGSTASEGVTRTRTCNSGSDLLLLRVLLLGLLVFLEKAGPFFVRGKLFVGRQHRIGRGHPDAHLQLGFSGSFHGAYSRGYVGVIAPDRRSNVSAAHNQVVGRVETHPADMRKKRLDPCMRGALVGAIRVLGIAMQVAAHIPAWNS